MQIIGSTGSHIQQCDIHSYGNNRRIEQLKLDDSKNLTFLHIARQTMLYFNT